MAIPVWFRGFTARNTPATRGKPNEPSLRGPRADNDVTSGPCGNFGHSLRCCALSPQGARSACSDTTQVTSNAAAGAHSTARRERTWRPITALHLTHVGRATLARRALCWTAMSAQRITEIPAWPTSTNPQPGCRKKWDGVVLPGAGAVPWSHDAVDRGRDCNEKGPVRGPFHLIWRRGRDSNPRYGSTVYTLSRRAPSTARPPLRTCLMLTASSALLSQTRCARSGVRVADPIHGVRPSGSLRSRQFAPGELVDRSATPPDLLDAYCLFCTPQPNALRAFRRARCRPLRWASCTGCGTLADRRGSVNRSAPVRVPDVVLSRGL